MAETSLQEMLATVPGELEEFSSGAQGAYERAAGFAKEAATLPQRLRDAISKKWEDNRDLIETRNKSLTEFFTAPAVGREKYQDVFDPFARERLVATSREQAGEKARTLTDLLTQRGQKMEDIVGRTSEAFGGEVSAAQLMASAAQSRFANALQIANYKTGLVNEIESQKQQEFSKLFNVLQLTGGEVEVGGKAYHIPGYEEQLKIKERITGPKGKTATQAAADARKTIQTLAISGATIDNVMSTGLTMGLDAEDVLNLYNAST